MERTPGNTPPRRRRGERRVAHRANDADDRVPRPIRQRTESLADRRPSGGVVEERLRRLLADDRLVAALSLDPIERSARR